MNRLKELRIENDLTMKDAARRLGLPYTTYVNYEKGQREPNSEILIKAAKSYGVTVDYLIGNVSEPYFYLDNKRILDEINDDGQEKPATISDDELNNMKLPSNVFPIPKMRRIPIVGTIRAGMPIFAEENIEGYEYDDVPEGEDCFFLRVKGDSMMNARICDGDLVLIKRQPCADDGQIVACLVNGDEATLKRFYQQGDMVILKPENPAYNPIIVPCADFDSGYARIIGIITEVKFKV